MNINSEIKQPLRIYDATNKQFFNRNPYNNDVNIPCLVVDKDKFMPITLTRTPAITDVVTHIYLYDMDGNESDNLTNLFTFTRLTSKDLDTDYLLYIANDSLSTSLPLGIYYMKLYDGTNTWYTDHFIIDHFTETVQLEYYNTVDMADFIYQETASGIFKNRFKLLGFIQDNGDIEDYEESVRDINYNKKKTYHRKQKIYQLVILCNSILYDALQIMAIHNTITLTNRLSESSQIEITDITPTGYEGTGYMKVVMKFKIKDDYYVYSETAENEEFAYRLLATKLGKYVSTKTGKIFKIR